MLDVVLRATGNGPPQGLEGGMSADSLETARLNNSSGWLFADSGESDRFSTIKSRGDVANLTSKLFNVPTTVK